ncbi:MAG: hypothetical protein ACRDL4_19730, partial [Thermoleophilaceae bacterium]
PAPADAAPASADAAPASADAAPASADAPAPADDVDETIAETEAVAAREPDVTEQETERASAPEGARLLALKMALDGRPREETAGYLAENFELADPDALLDEVYARAAR